MSLVMMSETYDVIVSFVAWQKYGATTFAKRADNDSVGGRQLRGSR